MGKMASSGLSSLLVLDGGELAGLLTRRDVGAYLEIRSDLSG